MSEGKNGSVWILYLLGGMIIALLMMRLPILGRYLFVTLGVLLLAGLGFGIYYLLQTIQKRRADREYRASSTGIIETRLAYCQEELSSNQAEKERIQQSLAELRQKAKGSSLNERNKQETEDLIAAYKSELSLRRAKIQFFEVCIQKLENLLHNQELARELEAKKKELRALQENHYEELAELEELKSNMEFDLTYLDTIESLTLEMPRTQTVDDAERLKLELEEMTKDLR